MLPIVDLETGEVVSDTGRSFEELTTVVDEGIDKTREVAQALSEIRYRWRVFKAEAGYNDFDEFCRDRWGFSRRHADRMIEALGVDNNIGPLGPNLLSPPTERHSRELARVEPERQADVWQAAVEAFGDKVTAAEVRQIADALPANVVDAAYEITDGAGKDELDRLRFRAAFFRSLKAAAQLLAYQPVHVAAALGVDEKQSEIDSLLRVLGKWSSDIDNLQGSGLRLVKGATS